MIKSTTVRGWVVVTSVARALALTASAGMLVGSVWLASLDADEAWRVGRLVDVQLRPSDNGELLGVANQGLASAVRRETAPR